MIVPMLRVGTHPLTLGVSQRVDAQGPVGVTTQRVGTIKAEVEVREGLRLMVRTYPCGSELLTSTGLPWSTRQIHPERIHAILTAHEYRTAVHQRYGFDNRQPQPVIGAAVAA